ncbi:MULTISPECIES: KilA-N domain-containing protein [unclassified Tolypothrix]|uniref:KilA-N domain-containing protein n=1 Tax=unclassified Tolypothrix TaxID=2649714 RepID=UPI0005EAC530|nr:MULTISPECIES: KilA-N domain-containing protein [unclassified Tolypothrix]BAY90791.1 virulence-associated E family protein [Microchaete diplosiphon NIES-3275]EKF04362.1 putative DNA-binding protein [Tolypothrix sp. PCC 7601]MBE9081009.1 KilA-N domain-containing protein [Tolypothrix sp. LEGE 11397]UYD24924.1 KilA-N domain-containing protein [Tolypothrix sp. PCC 7712]UYD32843.1 KilA-N domain-containing protein [Tolypothrix sp. PCC 7601]
MSQIERFDKLVQDARRNDDYINATRWCEHYGYRLGNWKQKTETKAKFEQLKTANPNTEPWIVERVGKTWVTWVHPIMAIHLASYFEPNFANYVAEIFISYVTADPTLAADIASRQETTEGRDIMKKAVQERYEFLNSKLMRGYYIIRDAWGDKLHYNTFTGEIQLNGSPLDLESLKFKLDLELDLKVEREDTKRIVEILAVVNTYPLMDAANQQRFGEKYSHWLKRKNFVPTKEYPTPPKFL